MRIQNLPTSLTGAWDRVAGGGSASSTANSSPFDQAADTADELILSDGTASSNSSCVYEPGSVAPKPLGNLTIDTGEQLELRTGALEARLVRLFAQHGIDTSVDVSLRTGSDGHVIVAGDHPQKAEIEQLFVANPSLRNEFVAVQAQTEFKRAAEEAIAFQEAYRKDPQAALEKFKHLFQERTDVFTMVFRDGEAQVKFAPRD